MRHAQLLSLCTLAGLGACASDPATTQARPEPSPEVTPEPVVEVEHEPADEWLTPFPHIRLSTARRTIEIDAYVSPLIHGGLDGQDYHLEQFVCVPNSKEHESLLVTEARPSHIHAALLLLGLEPGSPATFAPDGSGIDATGPEVRIQFRYEGGVVSPVAWTKHIDTGDPMPERDWVFAGSTMKSTRMGEVYEADAAGTVIGLASFGGETLSWPEYLSDLMETGDLEWLARTNAMPPAETPVTIVLRPVD